MTKETGLTILTIIFVLVIAFFSFTVGYCKGALDMIIFIYEEPVDEGDFTGDSNSNSDLLAI